MGLDAAESGEKKERDREEKQGSYSERDLEPKGGRTATNLPKSCF